MEKEKNKEKAREYVLLAELLVLCLGSALGIAQRFSWNGVDVPKEFGASARGYLFSGFLSLGGFLLSLLTFIVVKIKEGLYDSADYQRLVQRRNSLHGGRYEDADLKNLYAPLRGLAGLLLTGIIAALITALLQLTLGLVKSWMAAGVCIGLAAWTVVVLMFVLFQIWKNLRTWFDALDQWAKDHQAPDPGSKEPRKKQTSQL